MCRPTLAAVLAMTAAAEARIRLDASSRIAREAGSLAQRLKLLASSAEVEWQIPLYKDGIVDAWQAYISSLAALPDADRARLKGAIGSFKNLLNTRHWVAHGRYWRLKWALDRFPPRDVAETIQDLYGAFRETAAVEKLMTFS